MHDAFGSVSVFGCFVNTRCLFLLLHDLCCMFSSVFFSELHLTSQETFLKKNNNSSACLLVYFAAQNCKLASLRLVHLHVVVGNVYTCML